MTIWLTVFTGIVAVALLLQSLALLGLHKSVRQISARVDGLSAELIKNVSAVTSKTEEALVSVNASAKTVAALGDKLSLTADVIQKRIAEVDVFVRDVTDAARLEIARIQDVASNASRHIEDTFDTLHRTVLLPVSEFSAVIHGFRVGVDVLLGRSKRPSTGLHQDEEMFIG